MDAVSKLRPARRGTEEGRMTAQAERFAHPEAEAGEVWLGNVFAVDFKFIGWTTKRLGSKPYDSYGALLKGGNMRPVLVSRQEVEDAGVAIPAVGPINHRW
jgi:hypothetical protein